MLDLLIRDAQIVDGTGAPARHGDVGVRDGRIVAVGDVDEQASTIVALLTDPWVIVGRGGLGGVRPG